MKVIFENYSSTSGNISEENPHFLQMYNGGFPVINVIECLVSVVISLLSHLGQILIYLRKKCVFLNVNHNLAHASILLNLLLLGSKVGFLCFYVQRKNQLVQDQRL